MFQKNSKNKTQIKSKIKKSKLKIKNIFGGVAASLPANVNEGSVLPNSSRKFQSVWGDAVSTTTEGFIVTAKKQLHDFHFGLYSANLSVVYGSTNLAASDSFYFLMVPWQLLSLCSIGLVALYFGFRKYNAWIVSKSKSKA